MVKSSKLINFDANACSSLLLEVRQLLADYEPMLNPSSVHAAGQLARAAIEDARSQVLQSVGAGSDSYRVVFTSGATEGNNLIFNGLLGRSEHVITSASEHISVLAPLDSRHDIKVTKVSPDSVTGLISRTEVLANIKPETRLVSLIGANNETGVVTDFAGLSGEIAQRSGRAGRERVLLHTDGVQLLGKVPVKAGQWELDAITVSGHKIGALSGTGAVVIRKDVKLHAQILGGPQELFLRAGTENVLGILSFGIAAEAVSRSLNERRTRMKRNAERVKKEILSHCQPASLTVQTENTIPNTLSIHFPGLRADDLVIALDMKRILISSGSACASGKPNPSHVIMALGRSAEVARETIRISLEAEYGEDEVDYFISSFIECVKQMRQSAEAA